MLTDEKCRYIGANRSAISMTGYSRPELRDLTPRDIFSNALETETECAWQIVLTPRHRPVKEAILCCLGVDGLNVD
jgi:PAS domain S-box-containing protein